MHDFTYCAPTEIVFGQDAELKCGEEIQKFGGSRVMLVYGSGSVVKSGLLPRVQAQLTAAGLAVTLLGGVVPNPRVSLVRTGIAQALDFGVDFLLAVGGGSVIDTAKAIAIGVAQKEDDIWAVWTKKLPLRAALPVGAVLTIPAAGSEMSDSAVLTNEEDGEKRGVNSQVIRCRFAAINPALCATLPKYQLACGTVDAMMHTMDRFFTHPTDNELSDEFACGLLRCVSRNGARVVADASDYHAMSELVWGSTVSHNGLTGLGGVKCFAPHGLSHGISGHYDVAHGASLAAIWPSWARYCIDEDPARFAKFGREVWGLAASGDDKKDGLAAIDATEAFFRSLGMPVNFRELGVGPLDKASLEALADHASIRGTITLGAFKVLHRPDMLAIYELANK